MGFATVEKKGSRVVVRFNSVPKDDKDCSDYLHRLNYIYKKKQKFVILFDAYNVGFVSLKHIKKQVNFMRNKEEETRKYMVRAAILVSSSVSKLVVNSIFAIKKPVVPCRVFVNAEEAKAYLRAADF